MSPVLPTGEAAPHNVDGASAPGATTTTPAPTKVDAYRPRGMRGNKSALDLAPLLLRVVTAVFTLISFAIIASNSSTLYAFYTDGTFDSAKVKFSDFFFFSYLLTVNVIAFVYAISTIVLCVVLLSKSSISKSVVIAIFALDQIVSYLLMSASTSAATGIRIEKSLVSWEDSFLSKAYASIAFSFLAFFLLAGATLFSGLRLLRHS